MISDSLPRSHALPSVSRAALLAPVLLLAGSVPARAQSQCFDEWELAASPAQTGGVFGFCDLDGDTILVGAPGRAPTAMPATGAAYVFVRSGATWQLQGELVASDPDLGDEFGTRVAVSGDVAVVGAPDNSHAGGTEGSAYIFTRTGTSWSMAQRIDAPAPADGDEFGASVAIDGNWVVVGATEAGMNGGGAVFLYDGSAGWSHDSTFFSQGSGDDFGSDVDLDGDTLLVGAPSNFHVGGGLDRGAAYAYVRQGGAWQFQMKLTASDAADGDYFGYPVALSGDTAVIGSPEDDPGGSAYVFVRNGTAWSQQARLTAAEPLVVDGFGEDVAIAADRIVVGAAPDGTPGPGAAYLYDRSGSDWSHVATLLPGDSQVDDAFGACVAVSAAWTVVGAPGADDGATVEAGKAYVYDPSSDCSSYCSSLPNATGLPALLSASGHPGSSLVLTSSPVPNTPGLFFFGPSMLAGGASLGDGLRCVGGATTRTFPFVQAGMMMQPANTALFAVDYAAPYAAGLIGTKYFQHWFRSGLATGTGSNSSDGIEVTF